jgi:hypothetical protein
MAASYEAPTVATAAMAAVAVAPAPVPAVTVQTTAPAQAPTAAPARNAALELLGSLGTPEAATRSVTIRPDTTSLNATGGEIIRFDVGDKNFVWNFNGKRSSFDLAQVAPPGVLDHKVIVYVRPNPAYVRR